MPIYRPKRPFGCQNGMVIAGPETAIERARAAKAQTPVPSIRTPQARVLAALMPSDATEPQFDWPLVTRQQLAVRAGYTAISGTVTRALNGIKLGSSSGDPHPGLLTLGCIEEVVLDIEGKEEVNYRITKTGISAYQAYAAKHGELPAMRDKSVCTNNRYLKPQAEPTKDSLHPEGF